MKASGNFPSGFKEVALRLVIGTDLRHDSGTGIYHEVGTVHLTNTHDNPEIFEFRGRIENVPVQPARKSKNRVTPPQSPLLLRIFLITVNSMTTARVPSMHLGVKKLPE